MSENIGVQVVNLKLKLPDGSIWTNLSFQVPRGSLTYVYGLSADARTSLLRLIAGLNRLLDESIFLFGQPIQRLSRFWLSTYVHYVSGHTCPNFSYTVREYIGRGTENRLRDPLTNGEKEDLIADLLKRLQLEALVQRDCQQLTQQERLRVNVARAMMCNPAMLLLEDPFSKEKEAAQDLLADFLKSQVKLGRTILCTGQQPAVKALGDVPTIDLDSKAKLLRQGEAQRESKEDFLF